MGGIQEQNKALIFVSLFIAIAFLPFVQGLAFEQNSEANLTHPIRVSGGLPPPSVLCNITIIDPNKNTLVDFLAMTRIDNGKYYNYTLNTNQTAIIGKYDYDITCLSSSINKTESFEFYINPGGIDPSETKTQALTRTIYFLAGVGLIFFVAFLFSREGNPTYKYTYLILSALFFLISTNFIFISLQDEVVNPKIQNFFSSFVAVSFYIFWFLGFILAALWIIAIINTLILKNNERQMRSLGEYDFYG